MSEITSSSGLISRSCQSNSSATDFWWPFSHELVDEVWTKCKWSHLASASSVASAKESPLLPPAFSHELLDELYVTTSGSSPICHAHQTGGRAHAVLAAARR